MANRYQVTYEYVPLFMVANGIVKVVYLQKRVIYYGLRLSIMGRLRLGGLTCIGSGLAVDSMGPTVARRSIH